MLGRENATTAHELEVIDAALRGTTDAQPDDAALVDLTMKIRASRPTLSVVESDRLDESVGSQRDQQKTAPRRMRPVLAGLTTLLLVAAVSGVAMDRLQGEDDVVAVLKSDALDQPAAEFSDEMAVPAPPASNSKQTMAPAEGVEVPSAAATQDTAKQLSSLGTERHTERTAQISLRTGVDGLESVSNKIVGLTDELGGYVQDSQVQSGQRRGDASFTLMIPIEKYRESLSRISQFASVRSRSESTQDVTAGFDRAQRTRDRANARVERLQRQYDAASPLEKRELITGLTRAKARARSANTNYRENVRRVSYVPLSVGIVASEKVETEEAGPIDNALDKAGEILTTIAAGLIVVLAIVLPFVLIGAAIWVAARWSRRRRDGLTLRNAAAPQSE